MADKANKIHNAGEFGNYVHAVTIPMKIMMAAIVVFFAGAIAFCLFGKVETSIDCVVVSEDQCVCYVAALDREYVEVGDEITIDDSVYTVSNVSEDQTVIDESFGPAAREAGNFEIGDYVYTVKIDGDVPYGVFSATINTGYLNPLQVLLGS